MSHLLRKLSIRQRLWLIVALILLASVTMTAVPITYTADLFVDSQKNLTQVQVETAKKDRRTLLLDGAGRRAQEPRQSAWHSKHSRLPPLTTVTIFTCITGLTSS